MRTYNQRTGDILQKAELQKRKEGKRRNFAVAMGFSAAAAAILLAINLTLFLPYTTGGYDISAYRGSEYYQLMDEIGSLACTRESRTNNFNEWGLSWFDLLFEGCGAADKSGEAGAPGNESGPQTYLETTNNQVQGVVEGDLLKRSDKYLYYLSYAAPIYHKGGEVLVDEKGDPILDGNGDKQVTPSYTSPAKLVLTIYTVGGEKVNTYEISGEDTFTYNNYGRRREMYLTGDCTKILVLVPYYDGGAKALFTRILGIDVSDPASPREFARSSVSGDYVSSRLAGNTLLLVSNFAVTRDPDFSVQRQYLPEADGEILPMENIVLPDAPASARYTVLTSFSADTLAANGCEAYFDFSDAVYVSEAHIFTTRERTVRPQNGHGDVLPPPETYTDIACTSYDGMSLTYRGELSAFGTIVDQYSLDEYKGALRVFTTGNEPSCNFYCFDLSDFTLLAKKEDFAPIGDRVKSVRFDGDTAYVCTAVVTYSGPVAEIDDPVFEFDLRDYGNITFKDTGTIPGYSLNLVKFSGGTLLGIGYGNDFDELKIEVYASDEVTVTPLCQFKLPARFSSGFKAYFIDAENGLVGLQVEAYDDHKSGYLILRFDGYHLVELSTVPVSGDMDDARACLIGGTLFLFGSTVGGECVLNTFTP